MIQRSVSSVVILSIVTFGIYGIVWNWTNISALRAKGHDIMHPIFLIIPIANIILLWQFCGCIEKETNGKFSQVVALVLMIFLNIFGLNLALIQNAYNETVAAGGPTSSDPFASR